MRAAVTESLASIAANADRAEQERRVPDENIAALREAGLFRALQPSRYGGTPMGAEEYTPALVDIAGACASTAWVAGLLAQHSHLIGLMSAELQAQSLHVHLTTRIAGIDALVAEFERIRLAFASRFT